MRLREEAGRADQCLKIETRKPLLIEIERHLIAEHVTEILSKGLCVMLEEERLDDLARYPIFVTCLSLVRVSAISIACALSERTLWLHWLGKPADYTFLLCCHLGIPSPPCGAPSCWRYVWWKDSIFPAPSQRQSMLTIPPCVCVIVTQTVSIVSTDFSRAGADTRGHCVCNRAGQDDRPR